MRGTHLCGAAGAGHEAEAALRPAVEPGPELTCVGPLLLVLLCPGGDRGRGVGTAPGRTGTHQRRIAGTRCAGQAQEHCGRRFWEFFGTFLKKQKFPNKVKKSKKNPSNKNSQTK